MRARSWGIPRGSDAGRPVTGAQHPGQPPHICLAAGSIGRARAQQVYTRAVPQPQPQPPLQRTCASAVLAASASRLAASACVVAACALASAVLKPDWHCGRGRQEKRCRGRAGVSGGGLGSRGRRPERGGAGSSGRDCRRRGGARAHHAGGPRPRQRTAVSAAWWAASALSVSALDCLACSCWALACSSSFWA